MKTFSISLIIAFLYIIYGESAFSQKIIVEPGGVNNYPADKADYKKIKKESEYTLVDLPDSTDHVIFLKDLRTSDNYIFSVKAGNVDLTQTNKWYLYKLSKNTGQQFEFDEQMAAAHPELFTLGLIAFFNSTRLFPKGFDKVILVYFVHKAADGSVTYYKTLYLQSTFFLKSPKIIKLTTPSADLPRNVSYTAKDKLFDPSADAIYYPPAVTKPTVKTPVKPAAVTYLFNHSCDGKFNFTVKIEPGKSSSVIYINNGSQLKAVAGAPAQSATGSTAPAAPKNKIKIASPKANAPVADSSNTPDTSFTYSNADGFDEADFVSWIKNMYPILNTDCASYLAYKINDELRWRDTINADSIKAKATAKTAAASTKTATKGKLIKPGMVALLPSKPYTLTAKYTAKKTTYTDPVKFTVKLWLL